VGKTSRRVSGEGRVKGIELSSEVVGGLGGDSVDGATGKRRDTGRTRVGLPAAGVEVGVSSVMYGLPAGVVCGANRATGDAVDVVMWGGIMFVSVVVASVASTVEKVRDGSMAVVTCCVEFSVGLGECWLCAWLD
jgi:hypothetical protein